MLLAGGQYLFFLNFLISKFPLELAQGLSQQHFIHLQAILFLLSQHLFTTSYLFPSYLPHPILTYILDSS